MFFIRLEGFPCAATVWNIARVGKSFEKRFFINVVVFEAVKINELSWQRRRTEPWGYASSGANGVVGSGGLLICFLFTSSLSSSVDSVASTLPPPLSPFFPRPFISQVGCWVALDCYTGCTLYDSKDMILVEYRMNMVLSKCCQCTPYQQSMMAWLACLERQGKRLPLASNVISRVLALA